jgi:hypothetical protein
MECAAHAVAAVAVVLAALAGPAAIAAPRATAWTAAKAPLPAGAAASAGAGFFDVTCPSAALCVATGFYTDSAGNSQGLLLSGQGSTWAATKAPLPAGAVTTPSTQPLVSSVACSSGSACVAAGSYTDAAGNSRGLLLTGHGPSWTAIKVPLPAGAATSHSAVLTDVVCPSAAECVAAGYYSDSAGGQQGLLLTGHGSSWTATKAPLPAGAGTSEDVGLYGVTCPSTATCVAVGAYNRNGLLLGGHGSSWTASTAVLPAGASTPVSLSDVTCPSTATCVAAGRYGISRGAGWLLLTGHGSSWKAARTPLPADATGGPNPLLVQVSCPSAATCVAAGYYRTSGIGLQGFLLSGHGSSWTATKAPLPAGTPAGAEVVINEVSCPSAATCVAAGDDSGSKIQGLLLTGHGSSWTATQAPLPAGAATGPDATLSNVTCVSAAECVAVGSYTDSSGHGQGMLLTGPG